MKDSSLAVLEKSVSLPGAGKAYLDLGTRFIPGEDWKNLPGYEDYYQVSSFGRVWARSRYCRRVVMRSGNVKASRYVRSARHLRQSKNISGYLTVRLDNEVSRKVCTVHSLVMLAFVGPRPVGKVIDHRNEVKTDNTLLNLSYCTHAENSRRHHSLKGWARAFGIKS